MQERLADTHKKGRTKSELDLLEKAELCSSTEARFLVEKFMQLCLSILVQSFGLTTLYFSHSGNCCGAINEIVLPV